MHLSICQNTIESLKVFFTENQPGIRFRECIQDIKNGIKSTKLVAQRDFLNKLQRRKFVTREIRTTALKILGPNSRASDKRIRKEERKLLQTRIGEKEKEVRTARKNWWKPP